jgi:hypothetical protein
MCYMYVVLPGKMFPVGPVRSRLQLYLVSPLPLTYDSIPIST